MKRFLAAASALAFVAVASQASAADLAARNAPAYTKAPEYVQQVATWTGFYVGGSLGARSSDVNWTSVSTTDGFPMLISGKHDRSGHASPRRGEKRSDRSSPYVRHPAWVMPSRAGGRSLDGMRAVGGRASTVVPRSALLPSCSAEGVIGTFSYACAGPS